MSEFSKLKQQRKAKEAKSYTSSAQTSHETEGFTNDSNMVPTRTTGPILNSDGLYPSLPSVLDVRVNEKKPETGRGIYSKIHWKPGESTPKEKVIGMLKLYNTSTGDVLISVKPHVAALSNDNLETYCSSCFGPGSGSLRRCTGCKAVLYCDSVRLV
jgi:hypothetical protein